MEPIYTTFVIDRSGSMMSCGDSVFEGITGCIKNKQKLAKELNKQVYLTIYTFDDKIEILDIPHDPSKLTHEHYDVIKNNIEPRGWTRLYDTIHEAAKYTTTLQEKNNDEQSRGFMIIITDGEDNQSKISHNALKKEIECHKKTGMEYIFIGANINAKNTGSLLGIPQKSCLQFTPNPRLTRATFKTLTTSIKRSVTTNTGPTFTQEERDATYVPDIMQAPKPNPIVKPKLYTNDKEWLTNARKSLDIKNNDDWFKLSNKDTKDTKDTNLSALPDPDPDIVQTIGRIFRKKEASKLEYEKTMCPFTLINNQRKTSYQTSKGTVVKRRDYGPAMDFSSLYPSVMMDSNPNFSTLVKEYIKKEKNSNVKDSDVKEDNEPTIESIVEYKQRNKKDNTFARAYTFPIDTDEEIKKINKFWKEIEPEHTRHKNQTEK